nr:hypothetical protein [Tanacetum cinerariifolium]
TVVGDGGDIGSWRGGDGFGGEDGVEGVGCGGYGELEDDVLREKLSKINLLIAKIEALNFNSTSSSDFVLKSPIPVEDGDSFLEKFKTTSKLETFKFDIE